MKVTKVMLSAEDYALLFVEKGISNVVRLNDPTTYDKTIFMKHNIAHQDMYFTDGSVPTSSLVSQFIQTMDSAKGAVAVHCKAGLGRTGTMASAYLMHKYHFTAKESIAWIRIVRPGSIVGPQQHYLERLQPQLHSAHSRNNAKHKQSRYQQHQHQQHHQQRNVLLSHSGSIAPSPLLYETEYGGGGGGGGGGGHSGGGRSTMSMRVGQQHKQQHRQNLRPRTSHEESQQMKMQQLEVMQLGLGSTRMLRSSSGGRTTSQSTPS
jgi:protein-tyrosine phosphatase